MTDDSFEIDGQRDGSFREKALYLQLRNRCFGNGHFGTPDSAQKR